MKTFKLLSNKNRVFLKKKHENIQTSVTRKTDMPPKKHENIQTLVGRQKDIPQRKHENIRKLHEIRSKKLDRSCRLKKQYRILLGLFLCAGVCAAVAALAIVATQQAKALTKTTILTTLTTTTTSKISILLEIY